VANLRIRRYPDPTLAKRALEVSNIDGKTAGLLNNMVETMYTANGIGLAANQVGVLERAIVVDVDHENRGKQLLKLLNPAVVEASGEIVWEEGCLSVVDYSAEVMRSANICVRGWTIDEQEIEIEAEGLLAVCIQHEIDHLEGTLFIDRISRLKREIYRKRLKKLAKSDEASVDDGVLPL